MSLLEHLQAIYDEHGQLTPELVVEAARDKKHPLHTRVYDRPVRDAAEAYYRSRAHDLIVSVRIVYGEPDADGREKTVRAFHAMPATGPGAFVYEPIDTIADDPFKKQLLLQTMEREWKQLLARYESVGEFFSMVRHDLKRRKAA